ncbi:hypothetical protein ACX80K_11985, partial [Arthrobacter sp. MDT1-65]
MRTSVQRGLYGVLLAGGVVVLGSGSAVAADLSATSDTGLDSTLGAIITAPLQSGTTSGSILQEAVVSLDASLGLGADGTGSSGGPTGGILTGNVISPEVVVPVPVSGHSVAVLGDSSSTGGTGSTGSTGGSAPAPAPAVDGGILTGNVISPEVVVPVPVSGHSVAVLGDSSSTGGTG